MIKDESLYIAGPLVFYENGLKMWHSWRQEAEFHGYNVALPNEKQLEFEKGNKRSLSAAIFKNCRDSINETTTIIANLETYRGFMPDGGTVYEIGMAYAKGAKCYAYTRDKRSNGMKYPSAKYINDTQIDSDGRILANRTLPFGPCIMGACKVVEGNFSDALQALTLDIEESSRNKANRYLETKIITPKRTYTSEKPVVYLSSFERYDNDAKEQYASMKSVLEAKGFDVLTPLDKAVGVEVIETDDKYEKAYNQFDHYQQHVRNCDIILANLSDYQGYEPNDDVAFECGMAFQLGKKLFAYMSDTRPMVERIPNDGAAELPRDINGLNVEDFEAPLNLMFAASYRIYDGRFEEVVEKMVNELNNPSERKDLIEAII